MRFTRIFVFALIGLLGLPSALAQVATPPASSAAPSQNPAQPETAPPAAAPNAAPAGPITRPPEPADQPADTMPRRYVEMWNTGNFDNLPSLFFTPVAMVSHGNRVLLKPDMLRRVITAWRKSMPDLNFKIEDTIVQGDKIAMRLTFTGTYRDRLFPNTAAPDPKDPRIVHATEMLMFQLKNGRIHQIWEEYDEMFMRHRMGGTWHTDKELEAIAAAAPKSAKPAPAEEPPAEPAPKP